MQSVKAWEEEVSIPTYPIGKPEKNPVFLEKRVYQGSSGVVYPHPVIEKICDEKKNQVWNAVFLENDYVKIMVLPQLGGRIQMAFDKTKNRHFVYYNQVIKPALVGLTGPWISGGIEFNWPQHHRPGTYQPVDYTIETRADGSKTVWCSEIEKMFRTKGMAGFTLHPDRIYLEIKVKLYNRTPFPQTFLWWANPAVHVNDHYQSVFPPDVHAVFDHGKRDVSRFPIATGTYYKVDYAAGVDISRYKNIPVPTSYMAVSSKYDFVGGYEHDTQGGLLHVADHHVSPGKKQWTWGNGEFGKAWDRNLTDEDGSYIELMCGVYTDNQPDFSWIMPGEEKAFTQYFMPYRDVGIVKNATRDALVNLEIKGREIVIKAYATGSFQASRILLQHGEQLLLEDQFDFAPTNSYLKKINADQEIDPDALKISIISRQGKTLVAWQPEKPEIKPMPEPAKAAKPPAEVANNEQLYLTGLHLEQYRHATFNPVDYYREALRRDPGDVRNNNALGLWLLRRGQFEQAESYFRKAIETLTARNPNPYGGESYFNLGLSLKYQEKYDEACDAFYKATWNLVWKSSGYFELARLACPQEDLEKALELVDQSLIHQGHHHQARHLKTIILRKLNRLDAAAQLINESLEIDRFNFGALFEKYLLSQSSEELESLKVLMRDNLFSYQEIALDYAHAGFYTEGIDLLKIGLETIKAFNPIALYFMGWFAWKNNDMAGAKTYFDQAAQANPDYCFPHEIETVPALQTALKVNPNDAKAYYYLGNFWFHHRQYQEAVECWEKSRVLDDRYAVVHRNLALAYYNKQGQKQAARESLEKAFELDPGNERTLMELDQLYKKMNADPAKRLQLIDQYPELINERDDLYLEKATLLNLHRRHDEAHQLIMARKFHPWEGGEGKVTGQYMFSLVESAKNLLATGDYSRAIEKLESALVFPHNLGEGKLYGSRDNDIHFWLGLAHQKAGDVEKASDYFAQAAAGDYEPAAALFYNDQPPDKIFYQGLAFYQLNRADDAKSRFNKLIDYGERHLFDEVKIDYFAVSLPDLLVWDENLNARNRIHCRYMMALGHLGLKNHAKARPMLEEAHSMDRYHLGVQTHLWLLENEKLLEMVLAG